MKRRLDRESFWYAIPGAWFGNPGPKFQAYAVIDAERILDAVEYFRKHKRQVRITETRVSPREANAIHVSYVWLVDERAKQAA